MKTLILALGNPILSDDGVGWEVADRLEKRLPNVDIIRSSAATMDIIPKLVGYEQLIIIDAIQLGSAQPGTVHRFTPSDFSETIRFSSPHDINFATALQLGEQWGYYIPPDIRIYGIEVLELLKFSEGCTPQVDQKLDEVSDHIYRDLAE